MAITTNSIFMDAPQIHTVNNHAIQGQMVTARLEIAELEFVLNGITTDYEIEIKKRLLDILVQEMFANKSIEFTKMLDQQTGIYRFHARAFVVPDTMVRILRQSGY